jgi:hypothetical protein
LSPKPIASGPPKQTVIVKDVAYSTYRAVLYYVEYQLPQTALHCLTCFYTDLHELYWVRTTVILFSVPNVTQARPIHVCYHGSTSAYRKPGKYGNECQVVHGGRAKQSESLDCRLAQGQQRPRTTVLSKGSVQVSG